MNAPHAILAGGWIPFVIVSIMAVIFSIVYINSYRHKRHWNMCSFVVSSLGLAVVLATCTLVPVDIFLVSFMKDPSGHFKPWAEALDTRESIEQSMLYAYYAMYGCILLFMFVLLPFAFYYCEDRGERGRKFSSRFCNGLKYTILSLFVLAIVFVVGGFVSYVEKSQNETTAEWIPITTTGNYWERKHIENAMSFVMSVLTLVAMVPLVLYSGSGMAFWPVDLVRGRRSIRREQVDAEQQLLINQTEARCLRARNTLSSREQRRLAHLDERERLIQRQGSQLQEVERSCWYQFTNCCLRPIQIVIGMLLLLVALFIFTSLLMTNIDKIMNSLGPLKGYILPSPRLPHPIDITLVYLQQVFPLDYILVCVLILFLFSCSMSAIELIGIFGNCCTRYKIRTNATHPQGLLLLCSHLMLIVLALNVLVYQMAPQYGTFGSQTYIKNTTMSDGNFTSSVVPCSADAPYDACVMTRMSLLLLHFFYNLWFFGAAYFWLSWIFLAVFPLALIISVCIRRRSSVDIEVDDELDAGDDSSAGQRDNPTPEAQNHNYS